MGDSCVKYHCRFRCHSKISETDRTKIFEDFWTLQTQHQKWSYLDKLTVKRHLPQESRKKKSRTYNLEVKGALIKVCSRMFFNTLAINDQWLRTLDKKTSASGVIDQDRRGKHTKKGRILPRNTYRSVVKHIKKFPKVESHYCRKDTNVLYFLENNLNISIMYRLYLEDISKTSIQPASKSMYRSIFKGFRIAFNKPKKDLCDKCKAFKLLSKEDQELQQDEYDRHHAKKQLARDIKDLDVEKGKTTPNLCVSVYDLEKVLLLPQTNASQSYYKRKLKIHNFTIYDMSKNQGNCFLWNETVAKKGSDEIASNVYQYVAEMVLTGITDFIFYSDNCTGQNRNQMVFSMYAFACFKFKVNITHRFLEVGHTHNSGDSMHSRIEAVSRNQDVYTQEQWLDFIKRAAIKKPYKVTEIHQNDVFDFHKFCAYFNWKKVKVSTIKELKFTADVKKSVKIKREFDKESEEIKLCNSEKWKKHNFQPAYESLLKIDEDKKKHLLSFCSSGLIPEECKQFYYNIVNLPEQTDFTPRSNFLNLVHSFAEVRQVNEVECKCGVEIQDLQHIVWDCPLYTVQRENLKKRMDEENIVSPILLKQIIDQTDFLALTYIQQFLEECL